MATKDSAKIITDLINAAAEKIKEIGAGVNFEPAAQATAVALLDGLSAAARKSAADFAAAIKGMAEKERTALVSALEKSGIVDTMTLLTPPLRSAQSLNACLLEHEAAKTLYATADILFAYGNLVAGSIIEGSAVALDIAAQICDSNDEQQLENTIALMEQQIALLDRKISYIMDLPAGAAVPTTPPNTKPVSLTDLEKMLEVAKKFYKFEGFFTPTFKKDKQLIRIGPLASSPMPSPPIPILVTGFIDLSGMQEYDVVTVTTMVLEPAPSPQYAIWRVKTFSGRQASGLKHFQDFSDLLEVPGDGVELLIAQSASAHSFDNASLLTIPYQFLVETTVLPQFVIS